MKITILPEASTVSKALTLPEIADLLESHEYDAELLVFHLAKHVNRLQHELYWELSSRPFKRGQAGPGGAMQHELYWELGRNELNVEALNDAAELLFDIMRDQVNHQDEAEKWLRAYAPKYLAKERRVE